MDMAELISPAGIVPALRVTSKKQALQELAKRAAELIGEPERAIFEVLIGRERLGTTGVGHGIAIPHGKLASLTRLHCLFARLETPIDFDSSVGSSPSQTVTSSSSSNTVTFQSAPGL